MTKLTLKNNGCFKVTCHSCGNLTFGSPLDAEVMCHNPNCDDISNFTVEEITHDEVMRHFDREHLERLKNEKKDVEEEIKELEEKLYDKTNS